MIRLLSILVLVMMILLLVPTGLVLASQNAVPGDSSYPIKRKLEDIIISVASIHPATRAYFRLDFSKRRFQETTKLFSRGDSKQAFATLSELITQSQGASSEIRTLSDVNRKRELIDQMVKNLDDYQKQLTQIQDNQVGSTIEVIPTPSPTPIQRLPARNLEPQVTPTNTPTPVRLSPTPVPVRQGSPGLTPTEKKKLKDEIQKLKDEKRRLLDEVGTIERQSADMTNDSTRIAPTATPVPESSGTLIRDQDQRGLRIANTPTPTPVPVDDLIIAEQEVPTPTIRPVTPTPYALGPDCPGFPDEYAQCLGAAQNGTNATCYTKGTTNPTRDVCLESCGACTP